MCTPRHSRVQAELSQQSRVPLVMVTGVQLQEALAAVTVLGGLQDGSYATVCWPGKGTCQKTVHHAGF
jgi:hypothetical protein